MGIITRSVQVDAITWMETMTIPEYDKECDCDFCTTLRNERKAEREKVYDELGVLYGESAKKFQEYIDAPPTEEDRETAKRAYEIIEREDREKEKPIRKDEREKVLGKLEGKILDYISKLPGGTRILDWFSRSKR